jgi:hypothetical protein
MAAICSQLRTKEEAKTLLNAADITVDEADFNAAFELAEKVR